MESDGTSYETNTELLEKLDKIQIEIVNGSYQILWTKIDTSIFTNKFTFITHL